MAKEKKQPSAASASASNKAAAQPSAKGSKKKAAKAAVPAQSAAPMIDTNLAAVVAARRLAHRDELAAASATPSHGESAAFKQMKENLHKPAGQNMPPALQSPVAGKKFNNAVPGRHQQLGRNQTFGADVNRTGVPRRTGG